MRLRRERDPFAAGSDISQEEHRYAARSSELDSEFLAQALLYSISFPFFYLPTGSRAGSTMCRRTTNPTKLHHKRSRRLQPAMRVCMISHLLPRCPPGAPGSYKGNDVKLCLLLVSLAGGAAPSMAEVAESHLPNAAARKMKGIALAAPHWDASEAREGLMAWEEGAASGGFPPRSRSFSPSITAGERCEISPDEGEAGSTRTAHNHTSQSPRESRDERPPTTTAYTTKHIFEHQTRE